MKRRWSAALLVLATLLAGCAERKPAPEPELMEPVGVRLDTARVERGEIFEVAAYDFAVAPETEELTLLRDGVVDEVCVTLGQQVQAGAALVRLDVEQEREQIAQLDAREQYLRRDNEMTLELMRRDVELCRYRMEDDNRDYRAGGEREQLMENELERLETALRQEQERQELELRQLAEQRAALQAQVDGSVLTAPFDGQVVYLSSLQNGGSVQSGRTLAVLADPARLHLRGDFLSQSAVEGADEIWAQIGGQRAAIVYEEMDTEEYVSQLLSGEEMDTCFAFCDGAPQGVTAGDYAAVMVRTRTKKDVLWIPPNSLLRDAEGTYVYRVTPGGGRERVGVEAGYRNADAVEIVRGLAEGDEVYVQ